MKLGPAAAYLAMAFSVILVTFAGCGGGPDIELAQVSGTVQLDGKPIQSGTISFIPLDLAGPTAGAQIIDGAYFIGGENGVYIGECRVEISAMKKTQLIQDLEGLWLTAVGRFGVNQGLQRL